MKRKQLPDAITLRKLGLEFEVDPRTIIKVIRGEPVRGMAGQRAQRAVRTLQSRSVAGEY